MLSFGWLFRKKENTQITLAADNNLVPKTPHANFAQRPFVDETENSDTKSDALSYFENNLNQVATNLNETLGSWKKIKEDIIANDLSKEKSSLVAKKGMATGLRLLFKKFFQKIKESIEPASWELNDLLSTARDDIRDLCQHLEELVKELNSPQKSDEDKQAIKISICDISIEVINELLELIDNINTELKYCIRSEVITEQVAKSIVQFAVLFITNIPLPDFNFTLQDTYRNFLYNEIEPEKNSFDVLFTNIEGELEKIKKLLLTKQAPQVADKITQSSSALFAVQNNVLQDNESEAALIATPR